MLISINRKPLDKPWGGGNMLVKILVDALRNEGHTVVFDLPPELDIIVMIDPRHDSSGYSVDDIWRYQKAKSATNCRVLHRINECDQRKGSDFMDSLLYRSNEAVAHKTVFISSWLREYFEKRAWTDSEAQVIYNGCDASLFQHRTRPRAPGPLRLVTHHWSDNWMKGFDLYTEIDKYLENHDDFEFTYVGRYNKSFTPRNTNLVPACHGPALASELQGHDIYITASRFEPCGMHHIEGAASGLPVLYHSDGGGIVEGCENHGLSFSSFPEFLSQLEIMRNNLDSYRASIDHFYLSSERVAQEYVTVIERMK